MFELDPGFLIIIYGNLSLLKFLIGYLPYLTVPLDSFFQWSFYQDNPLFFVIKVFFIIISISDPLLFCLNL